MIFSTCLQRTRSGPRKRSVCPPPPKKRPLKFVQGTFTLGGSLTTSLCHTRVRCPFTLLVSRQVCGQVKYEILALFGPSDLLLGSHIQSICDALDVPHLEARWDIWIIYSADDSAVTHLNFTKINAWDSHLSEVIEKLSTTRWSSNDPCWLLT